MTRRFTELKKGTNVRFFMTTATALLVTGCGTVAPLSDELRSYRTPGTAVCENFGPETRCSRSDSSRVTRALEQMN
ncbi:MAG: hypothetical protein GTO71_09840, partial [Woeseiaceae bacterium]|nr:hypothetical protein [Woeseiaceae bacterium]NIP21385.1 hypothetical protein [Woeseiaceae bacterium]